MPEDIERAPRERDAGGVLAEPRRWTSAGCLDCDRLRVAPAGSVRERETGGYSGIHLAEPEARAVVEGLHVDDATRSELPAGLEHLNRESMGSIGEHRLAFGSYELGRLKWDFDIGCYFNLWVSAYLTGQHLDPQWLRRQLRMAPLILELIDGFSRLFRDVADELRRSGGFFRRNRGEFSLGPANLDFLSRVGLARTHGEVLKKNEQILESVRSRALSLMAADPPAAPTASLS